RGLLRLPVHRRAVVRGQRIDRAQPRGRPGVHRLHPVGRRGVRRDHHRRPGPGGPPARPAGRDGRPRLGRHLAPAGLDGRRRPRDLPDLLPRAAGPAAGFTSSISPRLTSVTLVESSGSVRTTIPSLVSLTILPVSVLPVVVNTTEALYWSEITLLGSMIDSTMSLKLNRPADWVR